MNYKRLRRIIKEIEEIKNKGKEDILFIGPINDSFFKWKVIIKGPKDTPYENGYFEFIITFPNRYPFTALDIRIVTKIFHINMDSDTGAINSDLIHITSWSPTTNLNMILNQIIDLLKNPVFNHFYILDPTKFKYLYNRDDYNKIAIEWTENYAKIYNKTAKERTEKYLKLYNKDKTELNELNEDINKIFNNFEIESHLISMKLQLFYEENKWLIDDEKKKILDLKKQLNNNSDNITELKKLISQIKMNKYIINNLDLKLSRLSETKEKLIVNYVSFDENIHYAINCEKTDKFSKIEELLYDKYPDYKNINNYFIVNGNQIIKDKSLKDNNIKDNDIITLFKSV